MDENALAQQFMQEYNASPRSGNVVSLPQTADDYMELAENTSAKKKMLEYLFKALELEPDYLDVSRMIANDSLDKMNPYGYQLFTIEELIHDYFENLFLFDSVNFLTGLTGA